MKTFKFAAVTVALLGSSAAMAAAPAYQYNSDAGIIRNTTGAVVGTTKTLFDTVTHPGAISPEIGTLGYGANLAWGLNDTVELQAGWSGMQFDDSVELDTDDSWINWGKALGGSYDDFKGDLSYDVDMSNPYLGVQMRPMRNWLTVGTGIIVPDNEFKAKLTPRQTSGNNSKITIDNIEYQIPDTTTIDMKVKNKNTLAPYATLGIRPNIGDRWGAFAEVGAAYMGEVESNVNVNGSVTTSQPLPGYSAATAVQQFEDQAEKEIETDLEWYPIAKVGLTYRF